MAPDNAPEPAETLLPSAPHLRRRQRSAAVTANAATTTAPPPLYLRANRGADNGHY
jgi:hypothetical protein